MLNRIKSVQHFSSFCHQIGKDSSASEDVSIELMDPKSSIKTAKYTLFIVDRRSKSPNKFAAFIVPLGRQVPNSYNSVLNDHFNLDLFSINWRVVLIIHCRQRNGLVVQFERGPEGAGRQCQISTIDCCSLGSGSPVSQSRTHPAGIELCRIQSTTQRLASKHPGSHYISSLHNSFAGNELLTEKKNLYSFDWFHKIWRYRFIRWTCNIYLPFIQRNIGFN